MTVHGARSTTYDRRHQGAKSGACGALVCIECAKSVGGGYYSLVSVHPDSDERRGITRVGPKRTSRKFCDVGCLKTWLDVNLSGHC